MDTAQARKERGAFYTPPTLTQFMTRWAVRHPGARVLEPSCGDAAFLVAAQQHGAALGGAPLALFGYEIFEPAAQSAWAQLGGKATIRTADFFEIPATGDFDVVLGNPPYIRYQRFAGESREKGLAAARAHGVKLPGLANAWAAFTVHAAQFLKPDGRMALVLPAALLTVNYAGPVRAFLMRRFARVRLVMFERRVFPGVQEEVVLLLAEGTGPAAALDVIQLEDANALADLAPDAVSHAAPQSHGGKWTAALLTEDEAAAYRDATQASPWTTMAQWGQVELGTVTGQNKFFALTAERIQRFGLTPHDLVPVVPPGAKHLRGLEMTADDMQALGDLGRTTQLFYPNPDALSAGAQRYIAWGEAEGVDQGYKCRNRSPWWRVPLTQVPDLIIGYMSGAVPRLVHNAARAHILNSCHGITLHPRLRFAAPLLPVLMLNSLTMLGAELIGRSYGGGVLKLEPRDVAQLPLPDAHAVAAAEDRISYARSLCAKAVRGGDWAKAVSQIDDLILRQSLGMTRRDIDTIRQAANKLRARRTKRGKAPR